MNLVNKIIIASSILVIGISNGYAKDDKSKYVLDRRIEHIDTLKHTPNFKSYNQSIDTIIKVKELDVKEIYDNIYDKPRKNDSIRAYNFNNYVA